MEKAHDASTRYEIWWCTATLAPYKAIHHFTEKRAQNPLTTP